MANFYPKYELRAIYSSLPDPLHDVIFSPETSDTLNAVAKAYALDQNQREALSVYSGFVMMGVLPPERFVKTLSEKLGVERNKASFIAQTINRDLFNPVKEYLELIHGVDEKNVSSPIVNIPTVATPPVPVRVVSRATVPTPTPPPAQTIPPVNPPVETGQPARANMLAGGPIRSDWGWHGRKNEVTGTIEFKREPMRVEALPKSAIFPQTTVTGVAHVGSVFEQKLGGAFGMKSEPAQEHTTPEASSPVSAKPVLHVPHKPTEIKIPPVQATQPPK